MARLINNAVFVAAAGGTGAFGVAGALQGFQTPAVAGATDGPTYRYRAQNTGLTEWEEGNGVFSGTGTVLSRTVITSSNANTLVSFTAAPNVVITLRAEDVLWFDQAMSLSAAQQSQARANIGALSVGTASIQTVAAGSTTAILSTTTLLVVTGAGGSLTTFLTFLSVAAGQTLQVLDWTTAPVNHEIRCTPNGAETIMKLAPYSLWSNAASLASATFIPAPTLSGWYIAP
jgi:hypothetical protein